MTFIFLGIAGIWGVIGGFDWFFDSYYCLNAGMFEEINNYLHTIRELETKLEHTSDLYEGSQKQVDDYIGEVEEQRQQIVLLNEKIELQQHSIKLLSTELDEVYNKDSQSE